MKLSIKKTFPKKIIIASGVIILLVAGVLTYVYAFHGNFFGWTSSKNTPSSTNQINYEPATPEQQQAGTAAKTGSSDTPAAPTATPGSTLKNVQVTITAPTGATKDGSVLQIRVLIGAVENTGTCTLVLSRAGQSSVTKTAGTQALSSSSTCQGFDVPTSELSVGTWQALITYESSTLTGTATRSITVQ